MLTCQVAGVKITDVDVEQQIFFPRQCIKQRDK